MTSDPVISPPRMIFNSIHILVASTPELADAACQAEARRLCDLNGGMFCIVFSGTQPDKTEHGEDALLMRVVELEGNPAAYLFYAPNVIVLSPTFVTTYDSDEVAWRAASSGHRAVIGLVAANVDEALRQFLSGSCMRLDQVPHTVDFVTWVSDGRMGGTRTVTKPTWD